MRPVLTTKYDGGRPTHADYNPMRKQGGLILGTGGDNSDRARGIFYEGAITTGYATAETEAAVQADVVDFDELETGERKEGAYVAVWNFLRKGGSAVAAGVGGLALSLGGYDPVAVEQAEPVKESLRLTVGLIPL